MRDIRRDISRTPTELFFEYLKTIYKELDKPIVQDYVDQVRQLDTFTFETDLPRHIETIRETIGKLDFIKSFTKRLKKDRYFTLMEQQIRIAYSKNKELEQTTFTIKNISNDYVVKTDNGTYSCKARGKFRNMKLVPLVGDYVTFSEDDLYNIEIVLSPETNRNIISLGTNNSVDETCLPSISKVII